MDRATWPKHSAIGWLFYDINSLHFEVDLDDEGVGPQDLVHGSQAAMAKTTARRASAGCPRTGRGDAPKIVVGLAVTREGFSARPWAFPGHTVDVVRTVAQVKEPALRCPDTLV